MSLNYLYQKEGREWGDEVDKRELNELETEKIERNHEHHSDGIYLNHRLRLAGVKLEDLREYIDKVSPDIDERPSVSCGVVDEQAEETFEDVL